MCCGCDLEFLLEKSLSVKVLINKEDFGIVGLILDEIEFRFCGCWVAEMIDFSGF